MERVRDFYADLESRLGEVDFVAGAALSAADITAFVTIDFATGALQLGIPETSTTIRRWYDALAARPGFSA